MRKGSRLGGSAQLCEQGAGFLGGIVVMLLDGQSQPFLEQGHGGLALAYLGQGATQHDARQHPISSVLAANAQVVEGFFPGTLLIEGLPEAEVKEWVVRIAGQSFT